MKKQDKELSNNDRNEIYTNLPILFNKKNKKVSIIKPLTLIESDTGNARHFTPAAQEWFNSIYSFNPNYTKSLPIADIGLMKLLKAYFSSELKKSLPKTKRLAIRWRRHSTKKIFVGRGEIKHSNSKAIITFYVHNAERLFLDRAIVLMTRLLYSPARPLRRYTHTNIHKQVKIAYNRALSFKEFWHIIAKPYYYKKWCTKIFVQKIDIINLVLSNINMQYYILNRMARMNLITVENKNKTFIRLCDSIKYFLPNPQFNEIMSLYEDSYVTHLSNFKTQLLLNINKFRYGFINKLIELIEKIYAKKVEFNIVKLKKLHFNSDLFTQAVALKLKNRNNRLYKVLKSSLYKVKLPKIDKVGEMYHYINKDDILVNIIRNNNISSMFKNNNNNNDPLNILLLNIFTDADNIEIKDIKTSLQNKISLQNYVLKYLKHLNIRGIRIEAKGRATRRLTAARSVFKMKWKGGLKNIDSSFKGLSTILLRGHVKSNIQHTYIGTKNRNGAIGVKGWVSSK